MAVRAPRLIITDMFREGGLRQRAIGIWSGTTGVGFAIGPIIGGLLLAHFWWGSVFLINVPIAATGFLFAIPLVPDSRDPSALRPDLTGALLSVAGLGLLLWSIIEAPVYGWSSALVIGVGVAGLAVLAGFTAWERITSHPMLNLRFFRKSSFSAPIGALGLAMFGLVGSLFVLTQFLQFNLGYSPLQAGVRMLPMAGAMAVVAPLSSIAVRRAGTRLTIATGMLLIAAGLWQTSYATTSWAFVDVLPGLIAAGAGAALVIPAVSGSVMNSLPRAHTGVGSATNGVFIQVGGALGVAVVGSLLSTRYQDQMTAALAHASVPPAVENTITGSIGGALAVAGQVGGQVGGSLSRLLAEAARSAFVSGGDLGLFTAAMVAFAGCVLALVAVPTKRRAVARDEAPDNHEPGPAAQASPRR